MQTQYVIRSEAPQVPPYDPAGMAQGLSAQLAHFLFPLLVELERRLDKRLVRTCVQLVAVILTFRDRVNGLLLSELGGYLLCPEHAPAGTKRLSNLLHSTRWSAALIRDYLWQRASEQLTHWQQAGQQGLVLWDESSWEKPESRQLEDLGPTRSSKAARLTHIKPGYDSPPGAPIFVPGMQWLAILLVGRLVEQGPPLLAAQRWWTNRGPHASFKRDEEGKLLVELAASWGRGVVHIFDQGFGSRVLAGASTGLRLALRAALAQGLSAPGCRGQPPPHLEDCGIRKRGWSQRWVWDARRARWVIATVLVLVVAHPEHPEQPLSLVVCRSQGRSPWYLLTADPIATDEQAWGVVFAYMRRWQIELSWKYEKSALADHQSTRLRGGSAREIAAVGYPGLRLLAQLTQRGHGTAAALAVALLLPPHGSPVSQRQGPAHPLALRASAACGKTTLPTSPWWALHARSST
jgi:hypothetical protein